MIGGGAETDRFEVGERGNRREPIAAVDRGRLQNVDAAFRRIDVGEDMVVREDETPSGTVLHKTTQGSRLSCGKADRPSSLAGARPERPNISRSDDVCWN